MSAPTTDARQALPPFKGSGSRARAPEPTASVAPPATQTEGRAGAAIAGPVLQFLSARFAPYPAPARAQGKVIDWAMAFLRGEEPCSEVGEVERLQQGNFESQEQAREQSSEEEAAAAQGLRVDEQRTRDPKAAQGSLANKPQGRTRR